MDEEQKEIDYYAENYPYHVEMFSRLQMDGDLLILFYENGKSSHFSISELGLTREIIVTRFEGQSGNIVYVYQDMQKTKDIAVELFDITGCCSGSRKVLVGYMGKEYLVGRI